MLPPAVKLRGVRKHVTAYYASSTLNSGFRRFGRSVRSAMVWQALAGDLIARVA
jgi:hypothetical protein